MKHISVFLALISVPQISCHQSLLFLSLGLWRSSVVLFMLLTGIAFMWLIRHLQEFNRPGAFCTVRMRPSEACFRKFPQVKNPIYIQRPSSLSKAEANLRHGRLLEQIPAHIGRRQRVHSWAATARSNTIFIHTLTPRANLESPIDLFLDCGRGWISLTDMGRTCNLYTESPSVWPTWIH